MNHASLMGVGQGLGGLQRPAGRQDKLQWGPLLLRLLQHGRQAAPLDKLHGIVEHALLLADGEDRHDVRMVQLGNRLRFAIESLHGVAVGNAGKAEDLQGHFAVERDLSGFTDHAHATPADLADDLEVAQSRSGIRRRSGRAMNELDAGEARLQLGGQGRMLGEQLLARGAPSRLQIGQVLVQHSDQFLAGDARLVGRRDVGRLRSLFRRLRFVSFGLVGIGHGPCSFWRGFHRVISVSRASIRLPQDYRARRPRNVTGKFGDFQEQYLPSDRRVAVEFIEGYFGFSGTKMPRRPLSVKAEWITKKCSYRPMRDNRRSIKSRSAPMQCGVVNATCRP